MRFWFGWLLTFALHSATAFSPYYANGKPARWDFNSTDLDARVFNTATKAIRFHIGNTATTANRTAELNAIRASFAQWQAISGTILKFEEAGAAPAGQDDIRLGDGINSVFWTTRTTINGEGWGSRAAYTLVALDENNRVIEADIALNAAGYSWFTDFNNTTAGSQFVESVVIHEIGHFLGLDHTPLGGACVIDGGAGVGPAAGLSPDEIAAARFLYPAASTLAQLGTIAGTVRMNGFVIRGAMVTAETSGGIAVSAAATDHDGNYKLPALPPGVYNLHVSPLDPDSASTSTSLFRAKDIAVDFGGAVTAFKATENSSANVTAGGATIRLFNVVEGEPAFRIQQISKPTTLAAAPSPVRYAVGVNPGQTIYVGVIGSALPPDGVLSITGNGITMGVQIYEANRFFGNLHLIQAPITIASDATPGLRTLVVRRGSDVAYANGYLEVFPPSPDYNFDGLDDRFQRQYFPLFTSAEAAPSADPDSDRFSNAFEALTGSNPINAQSYNFLIERVDLIRGAPRVTWKSDVGKQYQLYAKENIAGTAWQTVGSPITAMSNLTAQSDSGGAGGAKFYKLRLLP